MVRIFTIGILLVLTAAQPVPATAEDGSYTFFSAPILMGAHRGGADLWPENTIEAFKQAAVQFPGILLETDARLCADGAVVLIHDATIDRTTDGTGAVADLTLAEIKALDAGYRFTRDGGATFPYRGKGIRVPTLDEILVALPDSRFLIEFKGEPALAEASLRILREQRAIDRVLIASFKPETMARVRELAPELPTCYDFTDGAALLTALRSEAWDNYAPTNNVLSLDEGMLPQFQISMEDLQRIRGKGIKVQLHTINDLPRIREILSAGVDSILSDRPDLLAEAIAEFDPALTGKQAALDPARDATAK
ncbi:MAG: glycerophosphoryl diester phosphodiesterase [Candidatus Hydrogenedentota bacterium]